MSWLIIDDHMKFTVYSRTGKVVDSGTIVRRELKPGAQPELKPAAKPEVKPSAKPEVKPSAKPEPKPAVKQPAPK